MDDAHLLRCYVEQGSEAAFSELVGRYLNLVHSAAMRQVGGDYHRAKDVTQIVFTLLARKAGSLAQHATLTGWLYSTTHYSAGTVMRGERRRKFREEETQHMNELPADSDPGMDWNRLRTVLDGVMHELNESDREAILWRYFNAMPFAAIGEKMGINASGAKKRVDRALDQMCVSFAERGATSTTAALALMLENHAVVAAPAGLAESVTASALASAAIPPSQAPSLLKILAKARLALGTPGAIWLGSILAFTGIGAATYEIWAAWRANAAFAQENAGFETQIQDIRALKRTARTAFPAGAGAERPRPAVRDPKADFKEFLSAYPQARTALISQGKGIAARAYGSFFRSAGLTPAQIEQFESACAQSWIEQMTITPLQIATSGVRTPPEDQMRVLLGDAAYQQLQDYGPTVYAHFWASHLAGKLTGTALSGDQLDQLAQILASNNPSPQPAYSLDASSSVASIDWDTVLAQSKAVFSAAQWKAAEPDFLSLRAMGAVAAIQDPPVSATKP